MTDDNFHFAVVHTQGWLRQTDPKVIDAIDQLLDDLTDGQVANRLNLEGMRTGEGLEFTGNLVARIRRAYAIRPRYDRLRARGLLTQTELARELGVARVTVRTWHNHGLLKAHPYNDKNECLYDRPGEDRPIKQMGVKLKDRSQDLDVVSERTEKVQHEASSFKFGLRGGNRWPMADNPAD